MPEFSMDEVVKILTAKGVPNAYVEMTGGGCATIFAGPTFEEPDYGTRYMVAAGPGSFRWTEDSIGHTDEFCIGADDYGDGPNFYVSDLPGAATMTAEDVANLIHGFLVRAEYERLVRAIGMGFHPDTRGDNYTSLPDGVTPEDVDRIVTAACAATDFDVYEVALTITTEGATS
jgi:hypothetical protein